MGNKYEYKINFSETYLKNSKYKALEIGLQEVLDDMYKQNLLKHKSTVDIKLINGIVNIAMNVETKN